MPIDHSEQIRNKETFTFEIHRGNEIITTSQATIVSDCGNYQLFLDGIIYNRNKDQLISGFVSEGVDYTDQLEGNFLIFLIIGSTFHILTDKLNSRKSFYGLIDGSWYISNDIDQLPKEKCDISIDGIACYVANGVMLNNLTLFQEIKCAERSSIYRFEEGKISLEKYWEFAFDYPTEEPVDESYYKREFEKLLIQAVKRRYNPNKKTGLSLSAGYDARGILGILHHSLKVPNLFCFSYALDNPPVPGSDAFMAKKLAEECRYEHVAIKSYRGNLIDMLMSNVSQGKCLTNFSDEWDAWNYLMEKRLYNDVFAGDMSYGIGGNAETIEDILRITHVRTIEGIRWLKGNVSKSMYHAICKSIKRINDEIIRSTERFKYIQDKKDFLYFDQRINHALLPWRENICGQTGYVHLPYLDGDLLNFILKLPRSLRYGKTLYKETIFEMYPDLFSYPRAGTLGYKVNWIKEIAKHKKPIIEQIIQTESHLDEYISEKEMVKMIRRFHPTMCQMRAFYTKAVNYLRRKIPVFNQLMNKTTGPIQRFLTPDMFIIRLLLIRIYLTRDSLTSMNRNNSFNK